MRAARPWYGFLYYLLGAQGSFFAWLIAATGVYYTWREALIFLLNQSPREASVEELVAGEGGLKRWVRVAGVEIDLGSTLFAISGSRPAEGRTPSADTVLADRDDPTAAAWRELFRKIDTLGAQGDERLKELWTLLDEVGHEKNRGRYIPKRALVVVAPEREPRVPTATAAAPPAREDAPLRDPPSAVEALIEKWRRETTARVELVRRSVRVDVVREGLLTPWGAIERKYREAYGVTVARSTLVVGDRPSGLFAAFFAGFATILFFLIVGLRALGKAEPKPAPDAASPAGA